MGTTQVTSADGFRIPVTEQGHGRPILIVHPGGGTSAAWAGVARRLMVRFRVLRFDRRTYSVPGGAEVSLATIRICPVAARRLDRGYYTR